MPNDNRNNPPKTDKKVNTLPEKKGSASKDEQVKGGMMREQPRDV